MDSTPRPRQHLTAAGKLYDGAWRTYDEFRQARGLGLPAWPEWCYAPLAAAYAVVSGGGNNRISPHLIGDVARLGALAAWRPTQGIYRFDSSLYNAVIDTPLTGDLPCEILHRMPEWCVYVETPGLRWLGAGLYGFFAHMEWDAGTGREELRLLLDSEVALSPLPIHLGAWSLAEAVARAIDVSRVHAVAIGATIPPEAQRELVAAATPLVSLLLYLCADDAEIGDGSLRPCNPAPKRTKQGWRLFAADKPTTWDIGTRLGAALRKATLKAKGEHFADDPAAGHARPRAHGRRAHWHTYLTGSGRSERRLKWLSPIPVNVDDVDNLPATVRPVVE